MSQAFLEKLQATKERAANRDQTPAGGLYDARELESILSCKGGCSTNLGFGDDQSTNFSSLDPNKLDTDNLGDKPAQNPSGELNQSPPSLGPSLDEFESSGERKVQTNHRTTFSGTAWLSPYVAGFPPLSTQLQLVQCHNIGPDGFSFYFPLSFQRDIIAVRFCGTDHFVDLCAKIVQQKSIRIPGKGTGCLIDCQFMGKLFLK